MIFLRHVKISIKRYTFGDIIGYNILYLGQVDATRVAYRPRESPYPMITVDEAVAIVMEHALPLPEETYKFTGKKLMSNLLLLCFLRQVSQCFHNGALNLTLDLERLSW